MHLLFVHPFIQGILEDEELQRFHGFEDPSQKNEGLTCIQLNEQSFTASDLYEQKVAAQWMKGNKAEVYTHQNIA